ncbi:hypothetical protein EV360DRAFT_73057 [Lentinula raphanica]|nr:hypothetical protein EV360DRAFT_73057 [Lentinula raphanica]
MILADTKHKDEDLNTLNILLFGDLSIVRTQSDGVLSLSTIYMYQLLRVYNSSFLMVFEQPRLSRNSILVTKDVRCTLNIWKFESGFDLCFLEITLESFILLPGPLVPTAIMSSKVTAYYSFCHIHSLPGLRQGRAGLQVEICAKFQVTEAVYEGVGKHSWAFLSYANWAYLNSRLIWPILQKVAALLMQTTTRKIGDAEGQRTPAASTDLPRTYSLVEVYRDVLY